MDNPENSNNAHQGHHVESRDHEQREAAEQQAPKKKKKSVRWVEPTQLESIKYFK